MSEFVNNEALKAMSLSDPQNRLDQSFAEFDWLSQQKDASNSPDTRLLNTVEMLRES